LLQKSKGKKKKKREKKKKGDKRITLSPLPSPFDPISSRSQKSRKREKKKKRKEKNPQTCKVDTNMNSKRPLDHKRTQQRISKQRMTDGAITYRKHHPRRHRDEDSALTYEDGISKEESDSFSFQTWIDPLGEVEDTSSCLPALSDAFLLRTFQYLNCIDLIAVTKTCKRFEKIARDASLWKIVDFEATGRAHEVT
jgi:hypothetical protein